MPSLYSSIFVVIATFILLRIYLLLHAINSPTKKSPRTRADTCALAVFLGSGGHTSEALMLISSIDFARYTPRTYFISQGDSLSEQKAIALESSKAADYQPHLGSPVNAPPYRFIVVPRARHVHQSILTAPFTAAYSLFTCVYHICIAPVLSRSSVADVLILNGPGTCFVLCIAVYLNKFFGLPAPKLFYIESFARVRSLSLSGKLLRPLVDKFIVQWKELLRDGKRGEWRGWLV